MGTYFSKPTSEAIGNTVGKVTTDVLQNQSIMKIVSDALKTLSQEGDSTTSKNQQNNVHLPPIHGGTPFIIAADKVVIVHIKPTPTPPKISPRS